MSDSRVGAREIQDDPRIFYYARKQKVFKKIMGEHVLKTQEPV